MRIEDIENEFGNRIAAIFRLPDGFAKREQVLEEITDQQHNLSFHEETSKMGGPLVKHGIIDYRINKTKKLIQLLRKELDRLEKIPALEG